MPEIWVFCNCDWNMRFFHFLSGGTNGLFSVRVGELIFIPRSARSWGGDFVNIRSCFFRLFFLFSPSRKISLSFLPVDRSTFLSDHFRYNFSFDFSEYTECHIRPKLPLNQCHYGFDPRKTIQIRLNKVSLVKSCPFGAWLPE